MKKNFSLLVLMAWVFITGFTFLSCASVKARGEFGSPSDMIGNYAYLSTDKVGVGGRIQIWSVDGFLTSIPINETEQLLIPAGEHTIKVQYWNDEPNKLFLDLVTSREPIAIYFDFRPGEYYTVDSHDDGESFVIEKAKDEKGSLKKVIDRSSVPGQSIWSYNTLDTTKQTKLEGTWILVDITTKDGKSMIGNADNAPVSFVFKGNYFEFKNEGALAMWKPNLIILFYKAGYFEIKDNQFFLNIFSDYNMATHKGLLKVENVGWFVQNDVIEDRNTEKYTYILDGDTLKLTGGFIGSIAVFKKQ